MGSIYPRLMNESRRVDIWRRLAVVLMLIGFVVAGTSGTSLGVLVLVLAMSAAMIGQARARARRRAAEEFAEEPGDKPPVGRPA